MRRRFDEIQNRRCRLFRLLGKREVTAVVQKDQAGSLDAALNKFRRLRRGEAVLFPVDDEGRNGDPGIRSGRRVQIVLGLYQGGERLQAGNRTVKGTSYGLIASAAFPLSPANAALLSALAK